MLEPAPPIITTNLPDIDFANATTQEPMFADDVIVDSFSPSSVVVEQLPNNINDKPGASATSEKEIPQPPPPSVPPAPVTSSSSKKKEKKESKKDKKDKEESGANNNNGKIRRSDRIKSKSSNKMTQEEFQQLISQISNGSITLPQSAQQTDQTTITATTTTITQSDATTEKPDDNNVEVDREEKKNQNENDQAVVLSTSNETNGDKPNKKEEVAVKDGESCTTAAVVADDKTTSCDDVVAMTSQEEGEKDDDDEERPPEDFEIIDENVYVGNTGSFRVRKEIRRMVCDCFSRITATNHHLAHHLAVEPPPCSHNCLNRLLMIECSKRCPFGELCCNKRMQRRTYAHTQVFRTSWKGWGLRSKYTIDKPGELVMEYCGEVINQIEFHRRSIQYSMDGQQHFYFMALSQDEVIDATTKGNRSRYINHSCDPNCETQKWTVNGRLKVGFFTLRPITAGEEITFDYQYERYGKLAQKCYCGSSNCRGYLGRAPSDEDNFLTFPIPLPNDVPSSTQAPSVKKDADKKQKKIIAFKDAIQKELQKYKNGLTSDSEVINLSRAMLRCETSQQRTTCLEILRKTNTAATALLKKFLRLHGLPLIWSWMIDIPPPPSSRDSDQTLSREQQIANERMKVEILTTLAVLPIPTKNMLDDSKVLPLVQRWQHEGSTNGCGENAGALVKPVVENGNAATQVAQDDKSQVDESVQDKGNEKHQTDEKSATTEPEATEPAATEPPATEPKGTEPAATEPEGTEPAATESAATEPEGTELAATEPEGTEPEGTELAATSEVEGEKPQNEKAEGDSLVGVDEVKKTSMKVYQLTTSLLQEWNKLKEVYRIPKKLPPPPSPAKHASPPPSSGDSRRGRGDNDDDQQHNSNSSKRKRSRSSPTRNHHTSSSGDHHRRKRYPDHEKTRRSSRRHDNDDHSNNNSDVESNHSKNKKQSEPCPEKISSLIEDIMGQYNRSKHKQQQQHNLASMLHQQQAAHINPPPPLPDHQQVYVYPAPPPIPFPLPQHPPQQMYGNNQPLVGANAYSYEDSISDQCLEAGGTSSSYTTEHAITTKPDVEILGSQNGRTIVSLTAEQLEQLKRMTTELMSKQQSGGSNSSSGVISHHNNHLSTTNRVADWLRQSRDHHDHSSTSSTSALSRDQRPAEAVVTSSAPEYPSREATDQPLPPNWSHAKDADGFVYYYHEISRTTQWEPPSCDDMNSVTSGGVAAHSKMITNQQGLAENQATNMKLLKKLKASDGGGEVNDGKKSRRVFQHKMSRFVVELLEEYRSSKCRVGRITSTKHFKILARKLSHIILQKEMKAVQVVEDLEFNANVQHKAREFVRVYMQRQGEVYVPNTTE